MPMQYGTHGTAEWGSILVRLRGWIILGKVHGKSRIASVYLFRDDEEGFGEGSKVWVGRGGGLLPRKCAPYVMGFQSTLSGT